MNDAAARTGREIDERRVDVSLKISCGPRKLRQFSGCRDVFEDACATSKQRHSIRFFRFVHVELDVDVAKRGANWREVMEQSSFVLAWLNCVLLTSYLVG